VELKRRKYKYIKRGKRHCETYQVKSRRKLKLEIENRMKKPLEKGKRQREEEEEEGSKDQKGTRWGGGGGGGGEVKWRMM
jgi:hypothetical protein